MRKINTLIQGVWAIPAVLLIRLIYPIVLIRVGTFYSSRIGHFVADSAQQFIELNSRDSNIIYFYWLDDCTCNKQWAKMVKRNLPVYWWVKYIDLWNHYLPGGDKHYYGAQQDADLDLHNSRDIEGVLENSGVTMMEFLPDECHEVKLWLKDQGWREGQPFICLLVRDSAYLEHEFSSTELNFDYHSYRNSDIDNYISAMEWVADQGVWVLRMGKKMLKPVQTNHHRIIDYAFLDDKNDLRDIWLFANCDLCISTVCGPDWISDIYRRPILYLNYIPLTDLISWSNSINYPKNLVWSSSGNSLTMEEYLKNGYVSTADYSKAGINIIDLTSDEILEVTQEAWKRINEEWIDTGEDLKLQKLFLEPFLSNSKNTRYLGKKHHGYIHPKLRISSIFLRNNSNFLQ